MFSKLRRVVCAVCAAVVMAAVSVSAAADYTYPIDDNQLCDEIKATTRDIHGYEGTFTYDLEDSASNNFFSLRFRLFNEFADAEFWNSDDVKVAVDVKLETKGADVIGCMPAFTTNWDWIETEQYTKLKYDEWMTLTDSGKYLYEYFKGKTPAYVLFQIRTNWGAPAQGTVKFTVRNFRIISGDGTTAVQPEQTTTAATTTETTTTAATTSAPEETTAVQPTEEPVIKTEEPVDASSESADNATSESVLTNEQETVEAAVTTADTGITTPPESSAPSETTTINIPEMEGEQPQDYSEYYKKESPMMMIFIIVGVAALISAGAVVGYLIYRKKKYY